MKIGLLDVDSKIPNLALMKISKYYKDKGHDVEFYNPMFYYDRLYISKVFTYKDDYKYQLNAECIQKGGSGYNLNKTLPKEIENYTPDYNLYPNMDYAMGFTTRGCIRNCEFCLVPEKEGKIRAVNDIYDFWTGQDKIMLLDNNLTAHKEKFKRTLNDLIKEKVKVDFSQGLDIRILDEEQVKLLSEVNLWKGLRFAWDSMSIEDQVKNGIELLQEYGFTNYRKIMFYVLVGFNTTPEQDLYRVKKLDELGTSPFVMPYKDINGLDMKKIRSRCGFKNKYKYQEYLKDFARYVNRKHIFKTSEWKDYKKTS